MAKRKTTSHRTQRKQRKCNDMVMESFVFFLAIVFSKILCFFLYIIVAFCARGCISWAVIFSEMFAYVLLLFCLVKCGVFALGNTSPQHHSSCAWIQRLYSPKAASKGWLCLSVVTRPSHLEVSFKWVRETQASLLWQQMIQRVVSSRPVIPRFLSSFSPWGVTQYKDQSHQHCFTNLSLLETEVVQETLCLYEKNHICNMYKQLLCVAA